MKMVYLFVIQVSQAFAYAHSCNLTHGKFDLSQVILDGSLTEFKITNWRPWLAQSQTYDLLKECHSNNFRNLTSDQKTRIAKSRDLYDFGEALYDLMLNKYTRDEFISQRVVRQDEIQPVSGRESPIDLKNMASNKSK